MRESRSSPAWTRFSQFFRAWHPGQPVGHRINLATGLTNVSTQSPSIGCPCGGSGRVSGDHFTGATAVRFNNVRPTGYAFENNEPFALRIWMDFNANRWSAALDGQWVVEDQPLTTSAADLNLADLDAGWFVANTFWPGDNYMLFDDYRVALARDPQPLMVVEPANQAVELGQPAVFAVVVQGAEPLVYEWLKDGQVLPNRTGPALVFNATDATDAGNYRVRVSNRNGTVTSRDAILTVQQPIPIITSSPLSRTVVAGSDVQFSVVAVGAPPLSYHWRRGGADLPGATGVSLMLRGVSEAEAGEYTVRVSNPSGIAVSPPATLVVEPPTSFGDWVTAYLGAYPAAEQKPWADADRDGWSNAGEYALGTRPDDPTSRPQPAAELTEIGGVPHFVISFTPNPAARDLSFSGEFSLSLDPPEWSETGVTEISVGPPRVLGKAIEPGAYGGFLRLNVHLGE